MGFVCTYQLPNFTEMYLTYYLKSTNTLIKLPTQDKTSSSRALFKKGSKPTCQTVPIATRNTNYYIPPNNRDVTLAEASSSKREHNEELTKSI
jgi:hypothetical protein